MFCARCTKQGARIVTIAGQGGFQERGLPDRWFALPQGVQTWIEFKVDGKWLAPLQQRFMRDVVDRRVKALVGVFTSNTHIAMRCPISRDSLAEGPFGIEVIRDGLRNWSAW